MRELSDFEVNVRHTLQADITNPLAHSKNMEVLGKARERFFRERGAVLC